MTAQQTHEVHHTTEIKSVPRQVCGFSTTFILFAVGLSCIVVASLEIVNAPGNWDSAVNCGYNGRPPLLDYILGTGIAYLVIACAYGDVARRGISARNCNKYVVILSNTFIFAWMIVGAVSLWRDGKDCEVLNKTVWRMGYAAVIISMILCCCGGYTSYESVVVVDTNGEGGGGSGDVENQNK